MFGEINVLDKDSIRQYLYCLTPQPQAMTMSKMKGESINIGILDIVWRSNLGERGHLQKSPLQTMVKQIRNS